MKLLMRFVLRTMEGIDYILDEIPTYEQGRFYRSGGWGCRMGIARRALELDEKWGAGTW